MRYEKFIISDRDVTDARMSRDESRARFDANVLIVADAQFAYTLIIPLTVDKYFSLIQFRGIDIAWYALPLREIPVQRSVNAFVGLSSFPRARAQVCVCVYVCMCFFFIPGSFFCALPSCRSQ